MTLARLSVAMFLWCGASRAAPSPQNRASASFDDLVKRAGEVVDSSPEESAALYKQALAIRPNFTEGWLYLGAGLYQLRRFAEARDAFQKGIDLAPANGTAWGFLGLCRFDLGDPVGALQAIKKGEELELGGNQMFNAAVRTRAAQILLSSSSFDEALRQLAPLAQAGVNLPQSIEVAGLAALRIGSAYSSLTNLQHAMARLAGEAEWAALAARMEAALSGFQDLIGKYSNERGAHYAYGMLLKQDDRKGALAEFEKELKIDSSNASAYVEVALLMLDSSPDLALRAARAAAKLEPTNALAHLVLGRALLATGDTNQSIAELEQSQRLAPGEAETHIQLAEAFRKAGRQESAGQQERTVERIRSHQDHGVHSFEARRLPMPGGPSK